MFAHQCLQTELLSQCGLLDLGVQLALAAHNLLLHELNLLGALHDLKKRNESLTRIAMCCSAHLDTDLLILDLLLGLGGLQLVGQL